MNPDGKMRLAAYFNPTGHHVASWRHPRAQVDAHINIKHYVEIAQTAERAKLDLIFLADGVATRAGRHRGAMPLGAVHRAFRADHVAVGARHGDGTHRPDRHHVDELQRALPRGAKIRFARPHQRRTFGVESSSRRGNRLRRSISTAPSRFPIMSGIKRAHEFAEVVMGLWDSWDDDAFVRDQATAHQTGRTKRLGLGS